MDVFTMVVALVFISTVAGMVKRWLKLTEERSGQRMNGIASGADAQAREIDALRERVATLEAIVTDPKFDLRRKIEALRDTADA
jgi:polyhydroxyalkanoate synthesis regulator phasin